MRLGEFLVSRKLISRENLNRALEHQKKHGGRLGRIMVMLNLMTEDKLLSALKYHLEIPILELEDIAIGPEILKRVPKKLAEKYSLLPVKVTTSFGKRTLLVVMADPMDIEAINEVEFAAGIFVQPVLARERDLLRALNKYYGIETGFVATDFSRDSTSEDKDDMTIIMGGKQFTVYDDRSPRDVPDEEDSDTDGPTSPTIETPEPPGDFPRDYVEFTPDEERPAAPPSDRRTEKKPMTISDIERLYSSLPPASKKQMMKIIITKLVQQKRVSLNEIEQWFQSKS
jgi:hypothetical protein